MAMEITMSTVDRLIDGINGEDPAGARLYMAQLRQNETLSMLECFEDMLSGRLPVAPPPSFGNPLSRSSVSSVAYRVPPSDFLKVLLAGNTTRIGALHAVLQATGRGDLQGRAASLCVSEVRMCLAACISGAAADPCPPALSSGNDGDLRSGLTCWRPPLAQLRNLAGICLSFSIDIPPESPPAGRVAARGDGRSRKDIDNRRMLMLDALSAILGACCAAAAAAAAEKDDGSSECESDLGESDIESFPNACSDGGGRAVAAAAAAGSTRKGKGKLIGSQSRGGCRNTCTGGSSARSNRTGGNIRTSSACRPRRDSGLAGGGVSRRLPERGETVLSDVLDALLDRPWPPELALPLLVMFVDIHGLIEMLGSPTTESEREAGEGGGGNPELVRDGTEKDDAGARHSVWWRVRSRLMEVVWTGGLEGADFTGILRQVCVMCEIDEHRHWERLATRHCSSHLHQPEVSGYATSARRAANDRQTMAQVIPAPEYKGGSTGNRKGGGIWGAREGEEPSRRTCSASWISCLRELYATVPPGWLSTVELVLEQTLSQMPGVAESLFDAIQGTGGVQGAAEYPSHGDDIVTGARGGGRSSLTNKGFGEALVSMSNDLGLLLLLLREASPLRACSLPLLPEGMDRGRRAEEGVRRLLEAGQRCLQGSGEKAGERKFGNVDGAGCQASERGRHGGTLDGIRALLRGVLCSRSGEMVGGGGHSGPGGWVGAGSSGSDGRGKGGGEGESSGISSERASQLLELSIRWLEEGGMCNAPPRSGRAGYGIDSDCMDLTVENLATETILAVFDAVEGARLRLLRALLDGLFDQSQGGAVCAWGYIRTWEALMVQEAKQQCRRLMRYSRVVSDALGRLTLLPRGRARRVVESMLPLADVCPTQASALISLCRKCVARVENKGRLLALHAVTCILAWNARRARSGRRDGCLDQDGMQEDLVEMFRRAFESGLQIVAHADTLHLLSSKLATSVSLSFDRQSAALRGGIAANGTHDNRGLRQGSHLVPPTLTFLPAADLNALSGLREIFRMRLFRFLAHKGEILGVGSDVVGGSTNDGGPGAGQRDGYGSGGGGTSQSKGKQKVRRRRGGRFQFVPLRLLEERGTSSESHVIVGSDGHRDLDGGYCHARNVAGRGVIPRDAIGHLLKCCWALVPAFEGSIATGAGDRHEREAVGRGKRKDTEAIARAVLGAGSRWRGRQRRPRGGRHELSTNGIGVCTPEGEALVAVVEFLEGGGRMETVRLVTPLQTTTCPEGEDDLPLSHVPALPTCHQGVVGPLASLGVVVTLAEALVECLLSGLSCPPAMPFLRPRPCSTAAPDGTGNRRSHPSNSLGGGGGDSGGGRAGIEEDLVLWAAADVFTLLAAATRTAEGSMGTAGFLKNAKARAPADLSEIIALLPGETLGWGLSGGPEVTSGGAGTENAEEREAGGGPGKGAGGSGCGGKGDAEGQRSLLSASSALVFVKSFLGWAAREKRQSPAGLIAEGWDAGIGVWLGLMHSVRVLATTLELSRVGREGGAREGSEKNVWAEGEATEESGCCSSAESIALAVFELRAVVGTPSAAVDVLEPSAAEDTPLSSTEYASSPTPSVGAADPESYTRAENGTVPTTPPSSRRPPPGTMVTGFLKRMSERWKAVLDWGLPGSRPPRRASPRLDRKRHRGGRSGDRVADSLRAEAEDLFCALRSELLRTERLVLSALLVCPDVALGRRTWAMQAKLASMRRWEMGVLDEVAQPPPLSINAAATASTNPHSYGSGAAARYTYPGMVAGEEPEAGSGPPLLDTNGCRSPRGDLCRRVRAPTRGKGGGSGAPLPDTSARRRCDQGLKKRGKGGDCWRESTQQGLAVAAEVSLCGNSVEDVGDGLGRLCRLVGEEMREGLENGLSVKLTQAYLDLIELLGNASLERRRLTRMASVAADASLADVRAATVPQVACANEPPPALTAADDPAMSGVDQAGDDAGGVLLSILAGHCIVQATLFKRLVRAAVRFDGVGANHRRSCLQASRTAINTLAVLSARNNELLSAGTGDGVGGLSGRVGIGNDAAGDESACHIDSRGKGILVSRAISSRHPPPPLERCSRLLAHCVRWIRNRHGNRDGRRTVLIEEDASESSGDSDVGARDSGDEHRDSGYGKMGRGVGFDEGESFKFGDEQQYRSLSGGGGGRQGRCSSQPEDVRFATSRECYVAMHMTLMEFETALSMTGGLAPRSAFDADGSNGAGSELADAVATVASGLREVFTPLVTTWTTTTTGQPANTEQETAGALAPGTAPALGEDLASTTAPTKNHGEKEKGCGTEGSKKKPLPPTAIDVFPEHIKLLLMRVLDRVYLVGRTAAMAAAAALAKPSSTYIATIVAPPQTLSLPPPPPPPPPPPTSPPPPLSTQYGQQRAVETAGKPGDRAGGVPAKPGKCGNTVSARCGERNRRGAKVAIEGHVSATATASVGAASHSPRLTSSSRSSRSLSPLCLPLKNESKGQDGPRGGVCIDGGPAGPSVVRFIRMAGPGSAVPGGSQGRVAVLSVVLPVVALASGDSLEIMAAARRWTEGLRAKARRSGHDPCRKRVSTVLFKMDRCELEVSKAAHRARQFLDHVEEDVQVKIKIEMPGGGISASAAGVESAKKGKRGSVGRSSSSSSGGSGGGSQAVSKDAGGTVTNPCDLELGKALRLLLTGADTLAAWRRDASARKNARAGAKQRFSGDKGRARRAQRSGVAGAEDASEGSGEIGRAEQRVTSLDRFGRVPSKRRRLRGARVRSRNVVIDGWLDEGGEGIDPADAFVDLEDFIDG